MTAIAAAETAVLLVDLDQLGDASIPEAVGDAIAQAVERASEGVTVVLRTLANDAAAGVLARLAGAGAAAAPCQIPEQVAGPWAAVEAQLGQFYGVALRTAAALGRGPLFDFEVLVDRLCAALPAEGRDRRRLYALSGGAPRDAWAFLALAKADEPISVLESRDGLSGKSTATTVESAPRQFRHAVLGGTFDHLHPGHKLLLSVALLAAREAVTVGVTSRSMLGHKQFVERMEDEALRLKGVAAFLARFRAEAAFDRRVVLIHDAYGPTLTDATCDLLVGTAETARGCSAINVRRAELALAPLPVLLVSLIERNDEPLDGASAPWSGKISSTAIRQFLQQRGDR